MKIALKPSRKVCALKNVLAHLPPCVDMMIERVELFLVTKPSDVVFIR